jgi:hypothetical protein
MTMPRGTACVSGGTILVTQSVKECNSELRGRHLPFSVLERLRKNSAPGRKEIRQGLNRLGEKLMKEMKSFPQRLKPR